MEGFVSKYGCVFHDKCCLGIFVLFSTQISRKMTTTVRISKSNTPFVVHLRKMHPKRKSIAWYDNQLRIRNIQ